MTFHVQREAMVESQIRARGVRDERVLAAMRSVPREEFVPERLRTAAYEDGPLPIGFGQTISQPYIVASMTASLRLRPDDRVLEVGAGSGYAAAVLGQIAHEVFALERIPELAEQAAERIEKLGYSNVHVQVGDGTHGWPDHAPFDAIIVAAAGPEVPDILISQLADDGRLVMPVGSDRFDQRLVRLTRHGDRVERDELEFVRFVPLIGEHAWPE